jgi:hypothetical protein
VVAKLRPVADAGEALRANRVQIALVERVIAAAMTATGGALLPRRAARRAADDIGVVPSRRGGGERFAAKAMKLRPDRQARGVELTAALGAGYEYNE